MSGFLPVAFGGAVGACGRYAVSLLPWTGSFPLATLFTNFLGALLIGFIAGLSGRLPEQWTLFWKTGVRDGRYAAGALYILLSVLLCLGGVFLGQRMSQMIPRT